MKIERLQVNRGIQIPNENRCTNIGGVARVGANIFVIKTKQDNTVSTVYRYDSNNKYITKKFTDKLGHGNGLAYGNSLAYENGILAVPPCGNYLNVIDAKTWKRTQYKSSRYISAVAYRGMCVWLVKSQKSILETRLDERTKKLKFTDKWKIGNPVENAGFVISQDITYKHEKLFCLYSNSGKNQNCIVVFEMVNGEWTPTKIYESGRSDRLYEWESLDVSNDGDILIAANTADGDYLYHGCL
jgi:hypothetical protein